MVFLDFNSFMHSSRTRFTALNCDSIWLTYGFCGFVLLLAGFSAFRYELQQNLATAVESNRISLYIREQPA